VDSLIVVRFTTLNNIDMETLGNISRAQQTEVCVESALAPRGANRSRFRHLQGNGRVFRAILL